MPAIKLAHDALTRGLRVCDVAGAFKRYLHALAIEYRQAHEQRGPVFFRVYAQQVFVFGRHHDATTVITVWHLPNEFKAAAARTQRRIRHTSHPSHSSPEHHA